MTETAREGNMYRLVHCHICNRLMVSDSDGGICYTCKTKEREYQQKIRGRSWEEAFKKMEKYTQQPRGVA